MVQPRRKDNGAAADTIAKGEKTDRERQMVSHVVVVANRRLPLEFAPGTSL